MQFGGGGIPPVGILFDGGFDRIGDLLALAVLFGLESKGQSRVVAISVNRPDFAAAQFCDITKHYYTPGAFGGLPIGSVDGKQQPDPVYAKLLAETGDNAAPLFKPNVTRVLDTADPATVLRNALTASQPSNSIVIASGSVATVARLLSLIGSKPLIEGVVRHLIFAAPKLPGDPAARAAAQRLFDEWPTPIYLCGADIGEAIRYPGASIDKDFAALKNNPIAAAYRSFGDMPYDAPASPAAAALFAAHEKENLFKLSEPGKLRISASGAIELEPASDGKHRRLLVDTAQKDTVLKELTEYASLPPHPPSGRRGANANAKADPKEPQQIKKQQ
jgi:hypothetical protein